MIRHSKMRKFDVLRDEIYRFYQKCVNLMFRAMKIRCRHFITLLAFRLERVDAEGTFLK